MVITEDGIVDYIVCPLRYAFLWHYNVNAPEPRRLYRQCIRSGLSVLFRLLHEKRLDLNNLREALKPEMDRLPEALRPFIDSVMIRYADSMRDRQVLAYDLPVTTMINGVVFVGVLDVLFEEEGGIVAAAHVDDLPSSLENGARHALMGLVQDGFHDSIRDEIAARGQLLDWRSLVLRSTEIREESVPPAKLDASFLQAIGRCIDFRAFYPRWHRASCRSCGFRPVCDAEWATTERLSHPRSSSTILRARIQNADLSS